MEQHSLVNKRKDPFEREKYSRSTCKPMFIDGDTIECQAKKTLDFFSHCSSVEEWANEKDNVIFFKTRRVERPSRKTKGHQLTEKSQRMHNNVADQTIKSARTPIIPKRIVFTEEQTLTASKIKNCKPNKENFRVTKRKPNISKHQPLEIRVNNFVQDPIIEMEYIRQLMKKRFKEDSINSILTKIINKKTGNSSFIRI